MVTTTLSFLAVKGEATPNVTAEATTQVVLLDHLYYSPVVKACIVDNKPPILASIWAGPIALEVLIFSMTFHKGIAQARRVKSIANSPILYTLYRYGSHRSLM